MILVVRLGVPKVKCCVAPICGGGSVVGRPITGNVPMLYKVIALVRWRGEVFFMLSFANTWRHPWWAQRFRGIRKHSKSQHRLRPSCISSLASAQAGKCGSTSAHTHMYAHTHIYEQLTQDVSSCVYLPTLRFWTYAPCSQCMSSDGILLFDRRMTFRLPAHVRHACVVCKAWGSVSSCFCFRCFRRWPAWT